MKKNILIFIICVLSCNLYAQRHRKDLEHIIHWIDSMTVSLSIEQNKDIRGFVPFYNSQLNVREKTKLVGKIRELFEQNEYSNLYKLGHEIIREMWEYIYNDTNSFEIKQMLTELYLQYYFHPGAHKIVNSYDIRSKSYYNKKAKERIKEILEDKKTKEEYNACFLNNKSILLKSKSIWMEASEIMKQRENRSTEILKQIRDSVLTY
jgi:hypothetical protein